MVTPTFPKLLNSYCTCILDLRLCVQFVRKGNRYIWYFESLKFGIKMHQDMITTTMQMKTNAISLTNIQFNGSRANFVFFLIYQLHDVLLWSVRYTWPACVDILWRWRLHFRHSWMHVSMDKHTLCVNYRFGCLIFYSNRQY